MEDFFIGTFDGQYRPFHLSPPWLPEGGAPDLITPENFFAPPDLKPFEAVAFALHPRRGVCPLTPFANGWHRVGLVPLLSVLDGATPGDLCREMCLHCGRVFPKGGFVPLAQPNSLGSGLVARETQVKAAALAHLEAHPEPAEGEVNDDSG